MDKIETKIGHERHALTLARIARNLLNGDYSDLSKNGVKELIALYLCIPYMSKQTLDPPNELCKHPKFIDSVFLKDNGPIGLININDLRDTICHSFASYIEHIPFKAPYGGIVLDDRSNHTRHAHDLLGVNKLTNVLKVECINKRLKELIDQMIKSYINN